MLRRKKGRNQYSRKPDKATGEEKRDIPPDSPRTERSTMDWERGCAVKVKLAKKKKMRRKKEKKKGLAWQNHALRAARVAQGVEDFLKPCPPVLRGDVHGCAK